MAQEFKINFSLTYDDGEGSEFTIPPIVDLFENISTKKFIHQKISVGTSEEAFALGEVTVAGGVYVIVNWDDTNYVEVRHATGASNDVGKILPNGVMFGRWGSDVTAPYAVANTAACQVEYWFWSA